MFLRNWLVIVGCVQLLFTGPSSTTYCTCGLIKHTSDGAVCLSVIIDDDISSWQCAKIFFYTSGTCQPEIISACDECCQYLDGSCSSFGCSSNKSYSCDLFDKIGVTCYLRNAPGGDSSTNGQTTPTSSTTGTTMQSESTLYMTSSNSKFTSNMVTTPADGKTAAIIGGVVGSVGGFILIAAIILVATVFYRRRHKSPSNSNRTLGNSTSAANRKFNDYDRPNGVVSILPAPFTNLGNSPSEGVRDDNENGFYANEQSANPPPFNPTVEPDPYDNNYPIVAPGMSHGDTNETTVVDNQFYAGNPQSESFTMATDQVADDITLVDNQLYAGNPSETVTMATGDTTVVDNSFYGRA